MKRPDSDSTFGFLKFSFQILRGQIFVLLALNMLAAVLDSVGLSLFIPVLSGLSGATTQGSDFIDTLLETLHLSGNVEGILLFLVGVFVLKGGVIFYVHFFRVKIQQRLARQLRERAIRRTSNLSYGTFLDKSSGQTQNLLTLEIERVEQGFLDYFKSLQFIITILIYAIVCLYVDFVFALVVLSLSVVLNLVYTVLYKKTKGASRLISKDTAGYQNGVIQFLSAYKYMKATASFDTFFVQMGRMIDNIRVRKTRIGQLSAVTAAIREPMMIIIVVLSILIHINVFGGAIAGIMLSLVLFYRTLNALTLAQNSWNRYLNVFGSFEIVSSYLEVGVEESFSEREHKTPFQEIALKNVAVIFGRDEILKGVELNLGNAESIAIVGPSGSGKTTLVNVIMGLIQPSNGDVEIDGISLEMVVQSFGRRIGLVTQDPVVFNDTLYNNITLWSSSSDLNQRKYKKVLGQSGLEEFEETLEKTSNGVIETNGTNLSGGQKQRIAIARELFKDIDILVLDEATSALDSKSEQLIQESIQALQGSYLIIQIAHRLSSIKDVDRIVLMEEGHISQIDSYNDLLRTNSNFRVMVELQQLGDA